MVNRFRSWSEMTLSRARMTVSVSVGAPSAFLARASWMGSSLKFLGTVLRFVTGMDSPSESLGHVYTICNVVHVTRLRSTLVGAVEGAASHVSYQITSQVGVPFFEPDSP